MIETKIVSSLEKVMPRDCIADFEEIKSIKAAKGERVSFQVLVRDVNGEGVQIRNELIVNTRSKLSKYMSVSRVGYIPSMLPAFPDTDLRRKADGYYITTEPGLFPDVLYPLGKHEKVTAPKTSLLTLWVTVDIPEDIDAGRYGVCFAFTDENGSVGKCRADIDVRNVVIQKNDLIYTQWLHCDCIADYFGVKMMSEKHWKLIEEFIKTASKTGINMLLTPLFTPPLDTAVGSERPTMQLVGVTKTGDKYEFDLTLLDRWVDICHKYGIEYFEMSHLFTQWGVAYCPKIVVTVDGKPEKLFGWHTVSDSAQYLDFLSQLLPVLTKYLKNKGIADKCYFHISDEPSKEAGRPDFENYTKAKNFLKNYLEGFKMMDALSSIEFYDEGLVDIPVCATNHIKPFMERDIKERWCYYCCSQANTVANRFFAMPSYRNRISGVQFYTGDMKGFLHWGYNFYYSARAEHKIDPYNVSDAIEAFPSGDAYSVYPYKNSAIESLRAVVFYEGLQDRMLLKALENHIGRQKVLELIEQSAGGMIDFENYPKSAVFPVMLHDRVIDMLEKYGG